MFSIATATIWMSCSLLTCYMTKIVQVRWVYGACYVDDSLCCECCTGCPTDTPAAQRLKADNNSSIKQTAAGESRVNANLSQDFKQHIVLAHTCSLIVSAMCCLSTCTLQGARLVDQEVVPGCGKLICQVSWGIVVSSMFFSSAVPNGGSWTSAKRFNPYGLKVPTDQTNMVCCFCVFSHKTPLHRRWPATCHPSASSVPGPRDSCASLHSRQMQSDIPVASSPSTHQNKHTHTHTNYSLCICSDLEILFCHVGTNERFVRSVGHWLTSTKPKQLPCKCCGCMKSRDLWKVVPVASWDALSESWSALFYSGWEPGRWLNLQRTLLFQMRDSNHHPFQRQDKYNLPVFVRWKAVSWVTGIFHPPRIHSKYQISTSWWWPWMQKHAKS